jgi:hypothetical protein
MSVERKTSNEEPIELTTKMRSEVYTFMLRFVATFALAAGPSRLPAVGSGTRLGR